MGGVSPPISRSLFLIGLVFYGQLGNSAYVFPVLILSILHSLPTALPQCGQKVCQPTWLDIRTGGVEHGRRCFRAVRKRTSSRWQYTPRVIVVVGKWMHASVATELDPAFVAPSRRDSSTCLVGVKTASFATSTHSLAGTWNDGEWRNLPGWLNALNQCSSEAEVGFLTVQNAEKQALLEQGISCFGSWSC